MGREVAVLSKLAPVYSRAPAVIAFHDDPDVLGAPFYLMERRRGVILRKKLPKGFVVPPETFRKLGESLVDNLARLHSIDYTAAGLGELGKPAGFIERQVAGWRKRYQQAQTDDYPEVVQTAEWVAANMPVESGATLIHNDYKYDNLVLDPNDLTRITAVLDWEMCTLGDPLLDLGVSLSYWVQADDSEVLRHFIPGPTNLPGNLTRQEIIARYAAKTGRDTSNMLFYYAFGIFKLAVIIQQIYARYAKGHTRDERFAGLNHVVEGLGRAGLDAISKNRVP
jgi:aminoglycoside phosphotransferase (APT) family kinase protein